MSKITQLRERRAKAFSDAREIVTKAETENRDLLAEESERFDKFMAEGEELRTQIDRLESLELREAELRERPEPLRVVGGSPVEDRAAELRNTAFRGFLRGGVSSITPDERRALQADLDTSGGYLVAPQQFVTTLIQAVKNATFFRGLATVYSVPNADSLGAPALDTDVADPTWVSELSTGSADTALAFGKRELRPHPMAQRILVSRTLLRKAAEPEMIVRDRLAYKGAVVQENAFLNGTGANQPLGVFTASTAGISTGRDVSTGNATTSIKFDGLLEAKYTLKGNYWGGARWIFHRDAMKQIAKLKDGDGQYIWRPNVVAGEPDSVLGIPALMSEYAPSTFTTGLYVGILGDFSNYWIADAMDMQIQCLDELYAATNQVGFITRAETDGMPVLEEAFVRVKLA